MGDRIDEQYGRELDQQVREERKDDLKAAGDLLNPQQQKELQNFLVQNCWMKPAEARDVMDTINSLAGDVGAKVAGIQPKLANQVKEVVKNALEGHVRPKFLKNDDNFNPVTAMLTQAVEAREARIEQLHATAGTTQTAKAAPATPKAGR